jgi:predicted  nucleic acid-binding Zn-ribbon protein
MNKSKKKYVSEKCPKCGRVFLLGFNGMADGCDRCNRVVRNKSGEIVKIMGKAW